MGNRRRAGDYSYMTSVLANEVGLTAEGVRHYERKGVGAPLVGDNGYRSYHPQEVVVMRLIKNMTAYGMTLQQASDLVTAQPFDLGAFEGELARRRDDLVGRVRLAQVTLRRYDDQMAALRRLREGDGRPWTESHPAFWYLDYGTGVDARADAGLGALLRRWLDLMPLSYPMPVLTTRERGRSEDPFVAGGMAIDEGDLPDESYADERFCRRYPAREYLCCASRQTNQCGVTLADLDLDAVLGGREVDGDIFFQSVAASESQGRIVLYYKVLIPVA